MSEKYIINDTKCCESYTNWLGFSLDCSVPKTEETFPFCTAIETLCRRYEVSRGSLVTSEVRLPNSCRKFSPSTLCGPSVSTATATTWCVGVRSAYFCSFPTEACAAAAPAVTLVDGRCDIANVSGVVASQARHLPLAQGMRVTPSGLRLLPTIKPVGSLVEATSALINARCTMSLIIACLWWRPALLSQERPWLPRAFTWALQRQAWGMHRLAPRRKPVATLIASLVILRPIAVIGGAFSQSLACGDDTARRRARV